MDTAILKDFDNNENIIKDYSAKEEIMFQKLMKGQIDVVIMNEYSGDYFVNVHQMDRDVSKAGFRQVESGAAETLMGFSKDPRSQELIRIFNEGFKEKEKQGRLRQIEKKYLL